MIYLASDHGGFKLKETVLKYLTERGYETLDLGPYEFDPADDYPEYVVKLVGKVEQNPETNQGILICRNGVGVSMTANKFKKIRAGLSWSPEHAASLKKDDNTNVLALPADYIDEQTALDTVETWLKTPFSEEERHQRRIKKVQEFGQI